MSPVDMPSWHPAHTEAWMADQEILAGVELLRAADMLRLPRRLDVVVADPAVREAFAALWPALAGEP